MTRSIGDINYSEFQLTLPAQAQGSSAQTKTQEQEVQRSAKGKLQNDLSYSAELAHTSIPILSQFLPSESNEEDDTFVMIAVLKHDGQIWLYNGCASEIKSTTQKLRKITLAETNTSYAQRICAALKEYDSGKKNFLYGIHISSSSQAMYLILYQNRGTAEKTEVKSATISKGSFSPFALIPLARGHSCTINPQRNAKASTTDTTLKNEEHSRISLFESLLSPKTGRSQKESSFWFASTTSLFTHMAMYSQLALPFTIKAESIQQYKSALKRAKLALEAPGGLKEQNLKRATTARDLAVASDMLYSLSVVRFNQLAVACDVTRSKIAEAEKQIEEITERLILADLVSNPVSDDERDRVRRGLSEVCGSEAEWDKLCRLRAAEHEEQQKEDEWRAKYRAFWEEEERKLQSTKLTVQKWESLDSSTNRAPIYQTSPGMTNQLSELPNVKDTKSGLSELDFVLDSVMGDSTLELGSKRRANRKLGSTASSMPSVSVLKDVKPIAVSRESASRQVPIDLLETPMRRSTTKKVKTQQIIKREAR